MLYCMVAKVCTAERLILYEGYDDTLDLVYSIIISSPEDADIVFEYTELWEGERPIKTSFYIWHGKIWRIASKMWHEPFQTENIIIFMKYSC